MSIETSRSASAVIASVEVLARYASRHGIIEAQEALMDILASVHGWSADLPHADEGERHEPASGHGPRSTSPFSYPTTDRREPWFRPGPT
jgi:hypothetical protein